MLSTLLDWLPWVLGGGSALMLILYIVLLIFAKPWLDLVLAVVKPMFGVFGEFLGKVMSWVSEGLDDVMDNARTLFTMLLMLGLSFAGGYYYGKAAVKEKVIQELHQCYKFLPKKKWGC